MRHQVSEKIGPWVNEAIDGWVGGTEPILWEPQLMPEPKSGRVVVVCVVWMTGAAGPGSIQGSFTIPDPITASRASVHKQVQDFLADMYSARQQALDAMAPPEPPVAPAAAPQSGKTASGLFIATR